MKDWLQLVGPTQAVEILGVKLVGINAENGKKLLFSLAFYREVKDAMSRDILKALDEAGIGIASATFEITGLPALRIQDKTRGNRG